MIEAVNTFTLSREEANIAHMLNREVLEVRYSNGNVVYYEESPDGFSAQFCDQEYLAELLAW